MKLIVHVTEIRKAKGLTQADLAKLANVSRKTINTIENNVFVPSTILALTLAKVLDVSVHDLFELPDNRQSLTLSSSKVRQAGTDQPRCLWSAGALP